MHFTVTCHGNDPLALREVLERFANEQWLPTHVTRDEATEIIVDQFSRAIAQAMAVMDVQVETDGERRAATRLTLPCPDCGNETMEPIGYVLHSSGKRTAYVCSHCGHTEQCATTG
jgi:hypothetical protein